MKIQNYFTIGAVAAISIGVGLMIVKLLYTLEAAGLGR